MTARKSKQQVLRLPEDLYERLLQTAREEFEGNVSMTIKMYVDKYTPSREELDK